MVSKNEIKRLEISADDGAKLVIWDSANEGIPVIFAHGFPQTHLCWSGILEHLDPLRGQYRFITYDLRGFGDSAKTGEASWQRLLRDHLNVVSSLKISKYHFIGHDWGGATALRVSRFCPE